MRWDGQVAQDEEPGNMGFDVFEHDESPNVVYLCEAYVNQTIFEAHQANPPFRQFAGGLIDECIQSIELSMKAWTTAVWPPTE